LKNNYLIFLLTTIIFTGCNREIKIFSIGEKKIYNKMERIIYPELRKNSIVADKINNDIFFKATEMKRSWKYTDEIDKIKFFSNYDIKLREEEVISIRFDEVVYLPDSSRPYKEIKSITLNTDTGMEYSFSDFFKKDINYKKIINNYIKDYIISKNIDTLREFNGIDNEQEFYITGSELVIYFQPYVYTTRTYGPLIIPISYTTIKDILDKEYSDIFFNQYNNNNN
jgi:hypothetical protein